MNEVKALLLAAGLGTRLRPLTEDLPKCLMPIGGTPLLEYWLCALSRCNVTEAWINLHHHHDMVTSFLSRQLFSGWVHGVMEDQLLGTAGTLHANSQRFIETTTLLAHADNWCHCDFKDFLDFHFNYRPANTVMTMMTFRTQTPKSCGIVDVTDDGVVKGFFEKVSDPPSDRANGAVYLLEPQVVEWVAARPKAIDFSTDVIPEFLGRIATWENTEIHRDIGTMQSLIDAQGDKVSPPCWPSLQDSWSRTYQRNPIHTILSEIAEAE